MRPFFPARDDRGSLPMALLVVSIGLVLSVALLPLIVRQVQSTRGFTDRSSALNGAQVGLDVVMARVRAAADKLQGKIEDLPGCVVSGDAGVEGTGEKLEYRVEIEYYGINDKKLTCPPAELPVTATVKSTGTGNGGSRTVTAKYTFSTKNDTIDGGAIRIDTPATNTLCMDALTRTPAAGAAVTMRYCNGSSTQQFGYTKELYLKLINSESATAVNGFCLHSGTTHNAGNPLVFQPCPTSTSPAGLFQFSLDGASQFHAVSSTNGVEGLCVNVKNAGVSGSPVVLGDCNGSYTQTIWRSETTVGAGMAGDSTHQLVNYAQFSRCLDLTAKDPKATYMIAWFCKQDPQGKVDFNQQFVHPVPVAPAVSAEGNIVVTKSGVEYCLQSPLTTASTAYATVVNCDNVTPANPRTNDELWWKVVHNTGLYATSYQIIDKKGYCLAPTDLKATPLDVHIDGTSKVKVEECSSSELQKWNAPANLSRTTPISNVIEQ